MEIENTKSLKASSSIILFSQVFKIVIQVSSIVIFSRLLPPNLIGLYAMVAIVVALAELLRDFGLSTTAISSLELTDQQASNMFWMNLVQGLLAAILVAALSPFCAFVFNQPVLNELQPILAANLFINGFQIQYQVRLARRNKIWALAITDAFSPLVGLLAGLLAFSLGMGFWSLAVQSLVSPGLLALSRSLLARWKPSLPRRIRTLDGALNHSWRYGIGHILAFTTKNVDNFMIGLIWGPFSLGIYARAYQLQSLPIFGALAPMTNVVIPKLIQEQKSGSSNQSLLLQIQFSVGLASTFLYVLAASAAPLVLPLLLGKIWTQSSELFVVLALAGIIESLNFVNYWRFLAASQSHKYLQTNFWSAVFGVTNIVFWSFQGVLQVAFAVVVNQLVHWLITAVTLRGSSQTITKYFSRQGMVFMVSAVFSLWISIFAQRTLLDQNWPEFLVLALQVVLVGACVSSVVLLFPVTRRQFRAFLRRGNAGF